MKILYFGGQRSGKSSLAQKRALEFSSRPIYIATYDNSFGDLSMQKRINLHKSSRGESFDTVEEPLYLSKVIRRGEVYLIDCISMWILNTIGWEFDRVLEELDTLSGVEANIIFVLNSVGSGVIPADKISREYVDRSGLVGQRLAQICDEVIEVKLGLESRLK